MFSLTGDGSGRGSRRGENIFDVKCKAGSEHPFDGDMRMNTPLNKGHPASTLAPTRTAYRQTESKKGHKASTTKSIDPYSPTTHLP